VFEDNYRQVSRSLVLNPLAAAGSDSAGAATSFTSVA